MGTIFGPLVGSIVLISLGEFLRIFTGAGNVFFYGVLIVVVVLFMPNGVVGTLEEIVGRRVAREGP